MKIKTAYLFECSFKSSHDVRHKYVVAGSFCLAASLAHSLLRLWEDKDAYELYNIALREVVVTNA